MKIHPQLRVIQGQGSGPAGQNCRRTAGPAKAGSSSPGRDVVEIVSLENRRALDQTRPRDLSEAEEVLRQVRAELGRISPARARGLHRLEGLVQVFST